MVKTSNASYEKKFIVSIALSMRIPKIYFFGQGGPNFGGGMVGKFREMTKTGKPIVMQIREWSILTGNASL